MEFKDLNLAEMDKDLTLPEKEEWQAIYASYRSGSVVSGGVAGVDLHEFKIVPEGKKKAVAQTVRCLIVIKYRVKIIIPETEVFLENFDAGYHILHSMCGANVNYVITYIDRESGFAVASRKLALEKMQRAASRRRIQKGQIVDVNVVSVGKGVCTVNYAGYDVMLTQRDVSYSIVPDLRVIQSMIIATKRAKTAVTAIQKRLSKQASVKRKSKCRETETVYLSRSLLRKIKQH